jgi:hypothetical protein
MGDIKKIEPLSGWASFELDTTVLNPPIVKLKVSPIDLGQVKDVVDAGRGGKFSLVEKELLIEAVKEWDISLDGVALPCSEENKRKYLWLLLGLPVKAKEGETGQVFAHELLAYASDLENFVKN